MISRSIQRASDCLFWSAGQRQNRLLAEQRLASLIARALHVRKKRVKTSPTKSSREERLRVKKLRSRRKRDRGSGDFE